MVSLAEALVSENPDRLCFHGGAALFGERLAIFPGRSRAGKSTMIARLAAGGHTVFGDDILPLDEVGDGLALGVAPRLRLRLPAATSWPITPAPRTVATTISRCRKAAWRGAARQPLWGRWCCWTASRQDRRRFTTRRKGWH
jgi:hypothetical protein